MTQLKKIADGVYGVETSFRLPGGMRLPLRMTVLCCGDAVALLAPIPIDDALAAELAQLGEVRFLIAPNLLHYAYIADAAQRYPSARVLGAPGLAAKRPELPLQAEISADELPPQLEGHHVRGADKLSEVVFLHRPSRTLVVTDLVFNIHDAKGLSKIMLSLMSRALGKVEQSRLCRWLTTDRAVAAQSVADVLALSFDRVVMAHGDVIQTNAQAELSAGLWWMRGESRRPALAS